MGEKLRDGVNVNGTVQLIIQIYVKEEKKRAVYVR